MRYLSADVLLDEAHQNRELTKSGVDRDKHGVGRWDRRRIAEQKNATLHQRFPELAGIRIECTGKSEC